MWITGIIPLDRILTKKALRTSSESGEKPHPRGFRENIWNTLHPASFARSTERSREPAIEICTPTLTIQETSHRVHHLTNIRMRKILGDLFLVQKKGDETWFCTIILPRGTSLIPEIYVGQVNQCLIYITCGDQEGRHTNNYTESFCLQPLTGIHESYLPGNQWLV